MRHTRTSFDCSDNGSSAELGSGFSLGVPSRQAPYSPSGEDASSSVASGSIVAAAIASLVSNLIYIWQIKLYQSKKGSVYL
mmetsp:Transcript_20292/g.50455  ORF Transcript_20292/g.50455 Transcript_20292/m.50455 type:complete len:81 (-) Transcript_20292:62-304(-)